MDSSKGEGWEQGRGNSDGEKLTTETTSGASSPNRAADASSSAPAASQVSSTPPETTQHRKGIIDEATEFINDHIRIFRQLPWVIGGVGIVLLARFYPRLVFRRYKRPSDVPEQLIENNVTLTGIVANTGWNSVGVWHVPLWRRVLRLRHQPIDFYSDNELLNVKFAGVAVGNPEASEKWLESTLLGRRVWFTLLDHTSDWKALNCVVYAKRESWLIGGRKWCVNEQLLAKGFGSLDEVTGFKNEKGYTNFIHHLGRRETVAKRTGEGMWRGSEYVTWWRRLGRFLKLMS